MNATLERLRTLLVKDYKLAPERLTPDAPLEALGLDSLGVAELLFNVEDEFRIRLPPEPVPLATLGDVVRFIDALVAAQAVAGDAAMAAAMVPASVSASASASASVPTPGAAPAATPPAANPLPP